MFILFDQMAKVVEDEPARYDELLASYDADEEETLIEHLQMYAMATGPRVNAYLATKGFIVTMDGLHLLAPDSLDWAARVTALIDHDYNEGFEPRRNHAWPLFGFSGDDDADYNSSYLDAMFALWNDMVAKEYEFTELDPDHIAATRQDVVKYMDDLMWDKVAKFPEDAE